MSSYTAPPKPGQPAPYHGELGPDGLLRYRYRGTDPAHRDNVGMKRGMQQEVPLIYLYGIVVGEYLPIRPVPILQGGVRVSAEERYSQPRAANPVCREAWAAPGTPTPPRPS